jgi:hypothetical protein
MNLGAFLKQASTEAAAFATLAARPGAADQAPSDSVFHECREEIRWIALSAFHRSQCVSLAFRLSGHSHQPSALLILSGRKVCGVSHACV